jgi:hypothetical protein
MKALRWHGQKYVDGNADEPDCDARRRNQTPALMQPQETDAYRDAKEPGGDREVPRGRETQQ